MPLQPPNFFGLVDPSNPVGTDSRTISDDYHRMILQSMQDQGPNWTGAINATHTDLNLNTGLAAAGAKLMTGNAGTTIAAFANATAPVGWAIKAGFDGRMLVTAGTINGVTVAGGDVGGTDDPGLMDKVPAHPHGTGTLAVDVVPAGAQTLSIPHGRGAGGSGQRVPPDLGIMWDDGDRGSGIGENLCYGNGSIEGNNPNLVSNVNDHDHPTSISGETAENAGAANWVPLYTAMILCELQP